MNNEARSVDVKNVTDHEKIPARLHVLLAREAKVGVVIRRGPSKSVCTVLWDPERDTFKVGQWMKGRIYERRCDLSPDGRKFLYFAMNAKWESDTGGAWTAVSKTPYLKALSLYAKGDCWHGGGLFLSDREFWLNDGDGHLELIEWGEIKKKSNAHPSQSFGGECPNVYYNRLQRDGWTMLDGDEQDRAVFEKKLPDSWVIRKLAHAESSIGAPPGRGCYWDSHELHHVSGGTRFDCAEWEWADFVDGRLVWAAAGKLHAARLGKGKLLEEKVLHDFNDMKFERIAAPY